MEIISFSLNPNGTMSFTFREQTIDNGNLDTYVSIPEEDVSGILTSMGDSSKTLIDSLTEIALRYK